MNTKNIGLGILAVGVLCVLFSLFMDTTVTTAGGYAVNNIGLLARRQNTLIMGGFISIAGLLVAIFSDKLNINFGGGIEEREENPNASRLDGVNVKWPLIICFVTFAAIIAAIAINRM